MLRALVSVIVWLVAAGTTPAIAAPAQEADTARATLNGRWNMVFDMPQGSYETPVEFVVGQSGDVKATVLGPTGTFSITDTTGSLRDNRLRLDAKTSYGKLKVDTTLDGDRLGGKCAPASLVARLFFKGRMRGLRDRAHVPAPNLEAYEAAWGHIERGSMRPTSTV